MARTLKELALLLDGQGHTVTYAIDPEDGHKIAVLDWVAVSQVVDHYEGKIADLEKIIDGLKEDLENVPYTY